MKKEPLKKREKEYKKKKEEEIWEEYLTTLKKEPERTKRYKDQREVKGKDRIIEKIRKEIEQRKQIRVVIGETGQGMSSSALSFFKSMERLKNERNNKQKNNIYCGNSVFA